MKLFLIFRLSFIIYCVTMIVLLFRSIENSWKCPIGVDWDKIAEQLAAIAVFFFGAIVFIKVSQISYLLFLLFFVYWLSCCLFPKRPFLYYLCQRPGTACKMYYDIAAVIFIALYTYAVTYIIQKLQKLQDCQQTSSMHK